MSERCASGHLRTAANIYTYDDRPFCRPCRARNEKKRRERGLPYRCRKAWYALNAPRLRESARARYALNRERVLAFKRIALIARKIDPSAGEMGQLLELRAQYPRRRTVYV